MPPDPSTHVGPGARMLREVLFIVTALAVAIPAVLTTTPVPGKYKPAVATALTILGGVKVAVTGVVNLLESKGVIGTVGATPAPPTNPLVPLVVQSSSSANAGIGAVDLASLAASFVNTGQVPDGFPGMNLPGGGAALPATPDAIGLDHTHESAATTVADAYTAGTTGVPLAGAVPLVTPGQGPATIDGETVAHLDEPGHEHPAPAAAFDLAEAPGVIGEAGAEVALPPTRSRPSPAQRRRNYLADRSRDELRELAREANIPNRGRMNKAQLREALLADVFGG